MNKECSKYLEEQPSFVKASLLGWFFTPWQYSDNDFFFVRSKKENENKNQGYERGLEGRFQIENLT